MGCRLRPGHGAPSKCGVLAGGGKRPQVRGTERPRLSVGLLRYVRFFLQRVPTRQTLLSPPISLRQPTWWSVWRQDLPALFNSLTEWVLGTAVIDTLCVSPVPPSSGKGMAFIKEETEDMKIEFNKEEFEEIKTEETFSVKNEDIEEQTDASDPVLFGATDEEPFDNRRIPTPCLRWSPLNTARGYEHLPPLDEAVAAHLCPPAAVGWKWKRALPSKPCRTTSTLAGRAYTSAGQAASALHTMAIFQVFQAKLLRSLDESGVDEPAFRDLRSATDLALRATKATAQAIGHSMASLVVLERHLWLNLTEIKDLDKTAFLEAPVSPSRASGGWVYRVLHCDTKVLSGYETLFAQALQLRFKL
ncbi:hypothetical protein DPX16_0815 [Anabarilius grahami]|uniref:Uncharacterized protein n=1 Tax=Anabarilius grahami TaxID=495550 RepID=A0A3N0XK71_ANAGA|nr:hypothetical protein DPX16_0815 [Anabarilius grahami]